MARIIAVCKSDEKGTRKEQVSEGLLQTDFGFIDDAHADSCTHRQISLLALESINKMREAGYDVNPGDFAENLTTEGLELSSLPVGTSLRVGPDIVLEITQIGKECHSGCAIFRQVGKCIMPREGVFAKVVRGGVVRPGDELIIRKDN
ncbi:MAG: MOSC domain-containing protein [Dehalococcoidia bacterium]|nr:MOSC domain-containing protein [Dehalococcoidia bacterium]